MSKLLCHCGRQISDNYYPCSTEAFVETEENYESYSDKIDEKVNEFINCLLAGKRQEWIDSFYDFPHPGELSDAEVISDIYSRHKIVLSMCECSNCGRIYIQKAPMVNEYTCYEPKSGKYEQILKHKEEKNDG